MPAATTLAAKIEALATSAINGTVSEPERQVYRKIAQYARTLERGLAGRPLTQEQFFEISGGLIVPEPAPNGWEADTVEAALAVDVVQVEFEEVERVLREASGEYERARANVRSEDDRHALRELASAVAVAREDLDEVGRRVVAARSAHSALVRRDDHRHRLERSAADEAVGEEERRKREEERQSAGRRTLRKIVGKAPA
jgi:hypothetical protein